MFGMKFLRIQLLNMAFVGSWLIGLLLKRNEI